MPTFVIANAHSFIHSSLISVLIYRKFLVKKNSPKTEMYLHRLHSCTGKNCLNDSYTFTKIYREQKVRLEGGAIAQSVEQWSCNPVTRARNQGDALVPFGKALILIARSLGEYLKPSAVWLLTYKHLCFLSSQAK